MVEAIKQENGLLFKKNGEYINMDGAPLFLEGVSSRENLKNGLIADGIDAVTAQEITDAYFGQAQAPSEATATISPEDRALQEKRPLQGFELAQAYANKTGMPIEQAEIEVAQMPALTRSKLNDGSFLGGAGALLHDVSTMVPRGLAGLATAPFGMAPVETMGITEPTGQGTISDIAQSIYTDPSLTISAFAGPLAVNKIPSLTRMLNPSLSTTQKALNMGALGAGEGLVMSGTSAALRPLADQSPLEMQDIGMATLGGGVLGATTSLVGSGLTKYGAQKVKAPDISPTRIQQIENEMSQALQSGDIKLAQKATDELQKIGTFGGRPQEVTPKQWENMNTELRRVVQSMGKEDAPLWSALQANAALYKADPSKIGAEPYQVVVDKVFDPFFKKFGDEVERVSKRLNEIKQITLENAPPQAIDDFASEISPKNYSYSRNDEGKFVLLNRYGNEVKPQGQLAAHSKVLAFLNESAANKDGLIRPLEIDDELRKVVREMKTEKANSSLDQLYTDLNQYTKRKIYEADPALGDEYDKIQKQAAKHFEMEKGMNTVFGKEVGEFDFKSQKFTGEDFRKKAAQGVKNVSTNPQLYGEMIRVFQDFDDVYKGAGVNLQKAAMMAGAVSSQHGFTAGVGLKQYLAQMAEDASKLRAPKGKTAKVAHVAKKGAEGVAKYLNLVEPQTDAFISRIAGKSYNPYEKTGAFIEALGSPQKDTGKRVKLNRQQSLIRQIGRNQMIGNDDE
jgi:hypothetical protein